MSTIINATTTNGVVIQPDNSGSLVLQTNNGTTALTISTAQNATFAGTVAMSSSFLRNRIINGDMRIDQRNAGAASTNAINGYMVDRWQVNQSTTGKLIAQQNAGSVTPPAGFKYYLGATSQSSYSVGASDYYLFQQVIEGFNVADLDFGTANAKTITLSFWARSSLTGTFGGVLANGDANRSYPFTYTISSANTWTQVSITVPGDTSGTWFSTNGQGMFVRFGLGVGSTYNGTAGAWAGAVYLGATGATSVVGTNGATFYITGVQLEVGSTATPFERRLYGQELINCQRYCVKYDAGGTYQRYGVGLNYSTTQNSSVLYLPVEMRVQPTLTTTGTASNYAINHGSDSVTACNAVPTLAPAGSNTKIINLNATVASGLTAGGFGNLLSNANTSSYLLITAEL